MKDNVKDRTESITLKISWPEQMMQRMIYKSQIVGYDPHLLLNTPDEVWERVYAILSDKVLRFNPYAVDDDTLLACARRASWQPFPALTQMVIFHFREIRRIHREYDYDAVLFTVGDSDELQQIPIASLTGRVTYSATRRQIHVMVNDRPLTNQKMVEKMVGKDYFVTNALLASKINGTRVAAYRMFRLKGDVQAQADTIRARMIESKIAMLEEVLAYPYCRDYLRCSRHFVDYTSVISSAIESIRRFPYSAVLGSSV